jgi:predicted CXXCH cytochrome family protein
MASTRSNPKKRKRWHAHFAWTTTLVGAVAMSASLPLRGQAQDTGDSSPPRSASTAEAPRIDPAAASWTNPQCSGCHTPDPLFSHPVDIVPSFEIPADFPLFEGKMTCATCHDASSAAEHARARQDGSDLLRGTARGNDFCLQCHNQLGSSRADLHGAMLGQAHLRWGESRGFDGGRAARPSGPIAAENSTNCLTCHDGSVASDVGHDGLSAAARFGGPSFGQAGHPISIEYRADGANGPPLHMPGMLDDRIRLIKDRVECASCHSPYARSPGLLVMSNDRSSLCLSCHDL